jgi:peptidyl-prolyl cis-trans isomerase B (cyclophilin B)
MHRVRALAGLLPRRLGPLALLALALGAGGCDSAPQKPVASLRAVTLATGPHPVAIVRVKDLGEIRIELLPEAAPTTVAQFAKFSSEGFYDGTTFHRVIPDFMIQGGCPNTRNADPRDDGKGGGDYVLEDEFSNLPHQRGAVAMANRGSRNTGGTQFFIVHGDSLHLDGKHTVFGRVVEGMEVVDAITRLEIDKFGRYGPPDRPYPNAALVESIRVEGMAPPAAAPASGD